MEISEMEVTSVI